MLLRRLLRPPQQRNGTAHFGHGARRSPDRARAPAAVDAMCVAVRIERKTVAVVRAICGADEYVTHPPDGTPRQSVTPWISGALQTLSAPRRWARQRPARILDRLGIRLCRFGARSMRETAPVRNIRLPAAGRGTKGRALPHGEDAVTAADESAWSTRH